MVDLLLHYRAAVVQFQADMEKDDWRKEEGDFGLDQGSKASQNSDQVTEAERQHERRESQAVPDEQEGRWDSGDWSLEHEPGLDFVQDSFLGAQPLWGWILLLVVISQLVDKKKPQEEEVNKELQKGHQDDPSSVSQVEDVELSNLVAFLFDLSNFFRSEERHLSRDRVLRRQWGFPEWK